MKEFVARELGISVRQLEGIFKELRQKPKGIKLQEFTKVFNELLTTYPLRNQAQN